MDETLQLRIARRRDAIKRHRRTLALMEQTLRLVPSARKDEFLLRMRTIEDEVREMETQLHDLHVQQIREESKSQ